jgi:hypothetical protein
MSDDNQLVILVGGALYQNHHRATKMECSSWWRWKAGVIKDDDNKRASGLITIMIRSSNISSRIISSMSSRISSGNLMRVGRSSMSLIMIISRNGSSSSRCSSSDKLTCFGWKKLH